MKNEYNFPDLLKKITFKTITYNKNFDVIEKYESFITEYLGVVSLVRMNEEKPAIQIGEYYVSSFNFKLAKECNVDLIKSILRHKNEDSYKDLINIIKNNEIDLNNYNKIVYINNFIIKPEYRKKGITEEFIEYLYRNFYDEKSLIICLVKPFQLISDDYNYFLKTKKIEIKSFIGEKQHKTTSAKEYYLLDDLKNIKDIELNEYKLFGLAVKCGLNRINNSYIFTFTPNINLIKNIRLKTKEKIKDNLFNK
jgi:hypothetical protein